jgi:hypothetical protein
MPSSRHRLRVLVAGCALLLFGNSPALAQPSDGPAGSDNGPVAGPDHAQLDELIPHARGVFLADITRIKQEDGRPSDGGLFEGVDLHVREATGIRFTHLDLLIAWGGNVKGQYRSVTSPPPFPALKPGDLKLGRSYWFASDNVAPGSGRILSYWPADSAGVPDCIPRAVKYDAYQWVPHYTGDRDLIFGWRDDRKDTLVIFRAWRGRHLLWEHRDHGNLLVEFGLEEWGYLHLPQIEGLGSPPLSDTTNYFYDELEAFPPTGNEYAIGAHPWRIATYYNATTGQRVAARIRLDEGPDVERKFLGFEPTTQRVVYELDHDMLEHGGETVGFPYPGWVRLTERWWDPATGSLVRQEVRAADRGSRESGYHAGWRLVDPKLGLAAGPLGISSQ